MSTTIEPSRTPTPKAQRGFWAFAGCFGILSLIRGVDRLGDDHPLSGWLMLAGGTVMTLAFARMLWQLRSAKRRARSR